MQSTLWSKIMEAKSHWRIIDFVSDIHLQDANSTSAAFLNYVQHTPAQAIFLLGDIFEIWVGDDILDEPSADFTRHILSVLAQTAARGVDIYAMHGNRDFLLGERAAAQVPCTLLHDPCVLCVPQADAPWQRLLLSHGDALCLDDKPYQQFRALVRQSAWQQQFLQKPLVERIQMARHIRSESESRKQADGLGGYADIDPSAAQQWLLQYHCTQLVHGHTHRPGSHTLAYAPHLLQRHVLTDWDMAAKPVRAGGLRLSAPCGLSAPSASSGQWQLQPFDWAAQSLAANCKSI